MAGRVFAAASFLVAVLILAIAVFTHGFRPGTGASGESAPVLYSVSSTDNLLRRVDPASAATLGSVSINFPGKTVEGATGLATQPLTEELWAILKIANQSGRELVKIDPATGMVTDVGDTGGSFAGIAFSAPLTLLGVTGDGDAAHPESLFGLNTTTGAATLLRALGRGNDGEALAFNPDNGFLYHMSGSATGNPPVELILETINPGDLTTTDIPKSGASYREALGFTYWRSSAVFLMSDLNSKLFRVTPAGAVTLVGSLDHKAKGLAFVGPAPTPTPSPSPTASPSPSPTPTATPPGQQVKWGDVHCDGAVDSVDSLGDLRHLAHLSPLPHPSDCPEIDETVEVAGASPHAWGDADCDGAVNSIDALRILRFVAHLSLTPIAGCPDVGADVQIT